MYVYLLFLFSTSFFGVLILYFVIGAIVQLVRGKRGPEIIPNYEVWNAFFVLVLVSCLPFSGCHSDRLV